MGGHEHECKASSRSVGGEYMVAFEREKRQEKWKGRGRREIKAASVIYGWIAERRQVERTPVIDNEVERRDWGSATHDRSRSSYLGQIS